jgi:hypothetical protein
LLLVVSVVGAIIGRLLRRVVLTLAVVTSVLTGLVANATGQAGFEVVATASLPLLTVAIAGAIGGTLRGVREVRSERTPQEREAALRERRERAMRQSGA